MLQQQQFDLILLDLGLPDGNGMSLLHDITDCQGDIPVVIFSAQDLSVENKQKVLRKVKIKKHFMKKTKYFKNVFKLC